MEPSASNALSHRHLRWSEVELLTPSEDNGDDKCAQVHARSTMASVSEHGFNQASGSARTSQTHNGDEDGDAESHQRLISYSNLLANSLLAIANEAAPYLATCCETGLLARISPTGTVPQPTLTSAGVQYVAAFSAVLSTCQFACGLFNFLVAVVMALDGSKE